MIYPIMWKFGGYTLSTDELEQFLRFVRAPVFDNHRNEESRSATSCYQLLKWLKEQKLHRYVSANIVPWPIPGGAQQIIYTRFKITKETPETLTHWSGDGTIDKLVQRIFKAAGVTVEYKTILVKP